VAMYVLLNLMTDGIDVYRVASVLGCVLQLSHTQHRTRRVEHVHMHACNTKQ
jgi:hypothetical protein